MLLGDIGTAAVIKSQFFGYTWKYSWWCSSSGISVKADECRALEKASVSKKIFV